MHIDKNGDEVWTDAEIELAKNLSSEEHVEPSKSWPRPEEKIDTGGPAFPENTYKKVGKHEIGTCNPGMTLRHYFAGQALAGIIAGADKNMEADELARQSYISADAMIEAGK